MKVNFLQRLINPLGIILLCSVIIFLWFGKGLLFAGAEDELSFYNYTQSLKIYSHIWYAAGTGYSSLTSLPRLPYYLIFEPFFRLGISNVILQAVTFLILMLTGSLSAFFLVKEAIADNLKEEWKKLVPLLASIFYLLNPFSMTQIWGRGLPYQFFAFALVPSFLLFFVLSIQKKNLVFALIAAIISFFLSTAYVSPAVVITSWSTLSIYLIYYIFINRKSYINIYFALLSFIILLISWTLINFFWIYPTLKHGGEMLSSNLTVHDNIESLVALSPNNHFYNVIRLIHREYYDGTYGSSYSSIFFVLLSWLLPIFAIFSIPTFKKIPHFLFFISLLTISIFICIGANFPTGTMLIWLFEKISVLQVLRNPYEKFGINLVLAYSPFFAIGLLIFCEKLAKFYRNQRLTYFFILFFTLLLFIVLVWPMWRGNFAGGVRANFWVEIPKYYDSANTWLNAQEGDFNILHLPLLPEDGVTYTWGYPYEGIEASEFIFDKKSIARNFVVNKNYYSALLNRFGAGVDYKQLPHWSDDFEEFKEDYLYQELSKLNVRFIVLHYDTNYEKRKSVSPDQTKKYLESQDNIKKINEFGKLEIYKVDVPGNIDLIYSPDLKIDYKKINALKYLVDIKNVKEEIKLYFLQQFHPGWEAFINGEKIENHFEAFSYANMWKINELGNYQVTIKFIQQETVDTGIKIAFWTLGSLIIVLVAYLIKIWKPLF